MANVDAVVTDTHPLLFHAAGGRRLSPKARVIFDAAERGQAIVYVPMVVIMEVGLLVRGVRVNLHRPVRQFFDELFSNPAYQPHAIDARQVFDAEEMRFTRDRYDCLVAAASRDLGVPLVTRDQMIQDSGAVKTIW